MVTVEEAIETAKERIGVNLKVALKKELDKVLGNNRSGKNRWPRIANQITSALNRSIDFDVRGTQVIIHMNDYAKYLEWGTGVDGPEGKLIKAKTGKVMSWGSGNNKRFSKSTRGMRPSPFIRPVFHQQFLDLVIDSLVFELKKVTL